MRVPGSALRRNSLVLAELRRHPPVLPIAAGQRGLCRNGPFDGYHEDHSRRPAVAPLNDERSEASTFDPFAGGADQRVRTDGPMPSEPDDRKSRMSAAEARVRKCSVGSLGAAPEGDAGAEVEHSRELSPARIALPVQRIEAGDSAPAPELLRERSSVLADQFAVRLRTGLLPDDDEARR
jgi:hypothetical protein